jgi:uncharacterized protein
MWVVSDADSQLVLFGSVHVLPPGLDWTPPTLVRALHEADDVWFELPVGPQTDVEVAQLAAAKGYLPAGQRLSGLLSTQAAARLARVCQTYGLAAPLLEQFQPWMAEVVLAGAAYRAAGADAESGVEKALAAQAPPQATRRAFETPAQQIALFSGGPLAEQVASLEESLEELETDPQAYKDLVAAWMAADLSGLDKDALEPLREASPALYARMVTARNDAWTRTLDQRLKEAGRTVVVVGVGHLVGPDGLPARLRALGYSVKGP